VPEPGGAVLSFASDMCIAELADEGNQPVPDGTPSAKVLLTGLYNHTQPLIRYELTDRFTRHPHERVDRDPPVAEGVVGSSVHGGAQVAMVGVGWCAGQVRRTQDGLGRPRRSSAGSQETALTGTDSVRDFAKGPDLGRPLFAEGQRSVR
jgi:hypothetical protein